MVVAAEAGQEQLLLFDDGGMKEDQVSARSSVRRHGARAKVTAFEERKAMESARELARTTGQEQIPGREVQAERTQGVSREVTTLNCLLGHPTVTKKGAEDAIHNCNATGLCSRHSEGAAQAAHR